MKEIDYNLGEKYKIIDIYDFINRFKLEEVIKKIIKEELDITYYVEKVENNNEIDIFEYLDQNFDPEEDKINYILENLKYIEIGLIKYDFYTKEFISIDPNDPCNDGYYNFHFTSKGEIENIISDLEKLIEY